MGNTTSKPKPRQTSTSSNTPLNVDFAGPTTPRLRCRSSNDDYRATYPFGPSPGSAVSPIYSPTSAFHFSGGNEAREVTVTRFAGDTPPRSQINSFISPQSQDEPHEISEISQPKPMRPKINRLSELIDPVLLFENDETPVRSPSGALLSRRSFEEREDRPLSMRERQEKIKQRVEAQKAAFAQAQAHKNSNQNDVEKGGSNEKIAGDKEKKHRSCWSCFED